MTTHTRPATSAAEYQERAHDENKARELHPADCGSIDLDAFQAISAEERRAVWAVASEGDRRGLALQIIRRNQHGPDEATIALYLAELDTRFGSDRTIPDRDAILEAAKERGDTARHFGDVGGARQLDRVRMNLLNGARFQWDQGDLLIQSVNTPGAVYSVSARGCTCPAGAAGRISCWHIGLHDLLSDMQEDAALAADILADGAAAEREAAIETAASAEMGRRLAAARARLICEAA